MRFIAPKLITSTAARTAEDPVTAEYDVFITPALQKQIFLLQYPNRDRQKPYNVRSGKQIDQLRIKPKSKHLELDINLNTERNYNKYQGLKWGNAMQTGKQLQNDDATYGIASGFSGHRPRSTANRTPIKGQADREFDLQNDLATFYDAERENKVLVTQTLGGQIANHDGPDEAGKPLYFVGAFRGSELHLTKVDATVQMRPQFHHVDAEDQRNRLAATREYAAAVTAGAADGMEASGESRKPVEQARIVHQTFRASTNPKGELEQREHETKLALQAAEEEPWTTLEWVDEDDEEAYEVWNERMFVQDTEGCVRLQGVMSDEDFLDEISTPRRESPTRRRKRVQRRREWVDLGGEEDFERDGDGAS